MKVVAVVVVGQANQRPETAAVASARHEHVGGKDKNLRLTNLWRPLNLKQFKCVVLNPNSNNTYYYNNIHIWRITHWRKTFNQIVTKLGLIIAPALLVNLTSSFILLFKNLLRRKKQLQGNVLYSALLSWSWGWWREKLVIFGRRFDFSLISTFIALRVLADVPCYFDVFALNIFLCFWFVRVGTKNCHGDENYRSTRKAPNIIVTVFSE